VGLCKVESDIECLRINKKNKEICIYLLNSFSISIRIPYYEKQKDFETGFCCMEKKKISA
jgi:hypothetical protein